MAGPVLAESLLLYLTQMVDLALVAPLGEVALAAVGLAILPLYLFLGPVVGFSVGLASRISRATGAGREDEVERLTRHGLLIGLPLALLVAGALGLGASAVVRLMGAEPAVQGPAAAYLRLSSPGLAALFLSIVLGTAITAAGLPRIPLLFRGGGNLLGILLEWLLIYGHGGLPRLGLAGAALAGSLARVIACAGLLLWLLRRRRGSRIDPARLPGVDRQTWKSITAVGLPAALDRVLDALNYLLYTRWIAALGTAAVAQHYVVYNLQELPFMVAMALATGVGVAAGQQLGGGSEQGAREAAYRGGALALGAAVLVVALTHFFPEACLHFFTPGARPEPAQVAVLQVSGWVQLPMMVAVVFQGALGGVGDTRALVWISALGGWLVRLGLVWLLAFAAGWGLAGAWVAAGLDWALRLVLLGQRVRRRRWLGASEEPAFAR
ncbi:MAG TPA: MATE family efflux transporter [Thermoanaerobaculia bacterium]|nr:MATE family efflux transporter [Thermoanaerobaculia bacterium]